MEGMFNSFWNLILIIVSTKNTAQINALNFIIYSSLHQSWGTLDSGHVFCWVWQHAQYKVHVCSKPSCSEVRQVDMDRHWWKQSWSNTCLMWNYIFIPIHSENVILDNCFVWQVFTYFTPYGDKTTVSEVRWLIEKYIRFLTIVRCHPPRYICELEVR